jgi:hypothetical protein
MTKNSAKPRAWCREPARALAARGWGCVRRAWTRSDGHFDVLLVRVHARTRTASWHELIVVWALVVDDTLVERRTVYGRRPRRIPFKWADRCLSKYRRGDRATGCPLVDGRAAAVRRSPPRRAELPRSVAPRRETHLGSPIHKRAHAGTCPEVPTALPLVPPRGLLRRPYLDAVVSRSEYDLFVNVWDEWIRDHPALARPEHRKVMQELCLSAALIHRLALLLCGRPSRRVRAQLFKRYHWAVRRQDAIRGQLGLTRAQRLQGWCDGVPPTNLAVMVGSIPGSHGP